MGWGSTITVTVTVTWFRIFLNPRMAGTPTFLLHDEQSKRKKK
jgi:hypothetical protein